MPAHTPRDSAQPAQAQTLAQGPAAAIRLLADRGYEATTAEDLADAVGVSRSTFFRRFGSKDDVIFADHDLALAELEAHLSSTDLSPSEALITGTCNVLRLLIRDPEAARLRFVLVRQHEQLKERELVITHRYQRVFARYLRANLAADAPGWVAATFAAALVALHNQTLRNWLRDDVDDAPAALGTQLREVAAFYRDWLAPAVPPLTTATSAPAEAQPVLPSGSGSRVVVAVYDTGSSPDEVLAAVAAQLSH
ncbi:TetR/AcrR family transcriptional regulator [Leucobacter salsicius]|uniref:TetR/AcrR family transcriptional regulator n=1 Tax=Leucobacter salsicius TaxID=664638 RepID=UPI00034DB552|nr:TetR/AcrR family transcriptional regulator [Leucobacter salsicius]